MTVKENIFPPPRWRVQTDKAYYITADGVVFGHVVREVARMGWSAVVWVGRARYTISYHRIRRDAQNAVQDWWLEVADMAERLP